MLGPPHLTLFLATALATALAAAGGFVAGASSRAATAPHIYYVVSPPAAATPSQRPPCPEAPAPARIALQVQRVAPGGPIRFSVTSPGALGEGAWVGVIPSSVAHGSDEVNDTHDLDYRYVDGGQQSYEMPAPSEPGLYDLRLHDRYPNGAEIDSVSFEVAGY